MHPEECTENRKRTKYTFEYSVFMKKLPLWTCSIIFGKQVAPPSAATDNLTILMQHMLLYKLTIQHNYGLITHFNTFQLGS